MEKETKQHIQNENDKKPNQESKPSNQLSSDTG